MRITNSLFIDQGGRMVVGHRLKHPATALSDTKNGQATAFGRKAENGVYISRHVFHEKRGTACPHGVVVNVQYSAHGGLMKVIVKAASLPLGVAT